MADIAIVKTGVKAATGAQPDKSPVQKMGPSKFDSIRSQLSEQLANNLAVPQAKPLSAQQMATLETALRKRLTQSVSTNPAQLFGGEMKTTRANLNKLTQAVKKIPQNQGTASIRDSLTSIESQYQQSANLIGGSKSMDLQSLLKMQTDLYRMGENIQMLSKVVDQVTSGVKTIFQTQVG